MKERTYQLKKLGNRRWAVSQGEKFGTNVLREVFTSSKAVLNFVTNQNSNNLLYFNDMVVTPELTKKLDVVSFASRIREHYPDVDEFKFEGAKTIVVLKDGRTGTTVCHDGDEYNTRSGFLYAYDKARTKKFGMKNIIQLVKKGELPSGVLFKALLGQR